jgi:hypothetical protein
MLIPSCCDRARHTSLNTRHLWSVDELDEALTIAIQDIHEDSS